jgi:hypothetical protein
LFAAATKTAGSATRENPARGRRPDVGTNGTRARRRSRVAFVFFEAFVAFV